MIPHLWREPDIIRPGDEPGDIVIEKTISGRTVASAWTISEQKKRLLLKTIYRKKK